MAALNVVSFIHANSIHSSRDKYFLKFKSQFSHLSKEYLNSSAPSFIENIPCYKLTHVFTLFRAEDKNKTLAT